MGDIQVQDHETKARILYNFFKESLSKTVHISWTFDLAELYDDRADGALIHLDKPFFERFCMQSKEWIQIVLQARMVLVQASIKQPGNMSRGTSWTLCHLST